MYGYNNKILLVDLTKKTLEVMPLEDELLKQFPGGMSLGTRLIYEMMPAGTDVFAPESVIAFMCGALNASGAFMGCRYAVVSKSPVTGGINDANSGGNFGATLKRSGFDGVVVKGISETPVYIYIEDGKAEIRDASKYWGTTTTLSLEEALQEEIGKKIVAASIGRAGENLSYMAAVMNDGHRAAGRGGSGAVMGSKKLKAVVVAGGKGPEVANKEEMVAISKKVIDWQKNGPVKPFIESFTKWGTGASLESSLMTSDIGIKNWGGSYLDIKEDEITNLSAMTMDETRWRKKFACNACPIGCGAIYGIKGNGIETEHAGRPEYETSGAFGTNLLNMDADTVNYCNHLCNEYGADTISAGGTVAWLMECYENGLFTKEELDGIELTWGNQEAIREITRKICLGEGIGKILMNGSVYAAKYFNRGFEFRNDAGGIELPMHDPRLAPPLARTYKFDPAPGRHVKGGVGPMSGMSPPEYKNNPDAFLEDDVRGVEVSDVKASLGCCEFTGPGYPDGGAWEYYNAMTGLDLTAEDFLNTGLRTFLLRQVFNLREGLRRKDTFLAERLQGIPPMKEGPLEGITVDVEKMGDNFYQAIGCTLDGIPKPETLEKLGGFEFLMQDLAAIQP